MEPNYWNQITGGRVARRRLLKSGAAFSIGAAALALIGCGSDSGGDDGGAEEAVGGPNTGTTGDPKPGGTLGHYYAGSIGNYNVIGFYHDGYRNTGITVYDRPITARLDKRGYVLEAVEKLELVEPTRLVMTLKPDMVYQNKAPVNGRKVVASDIVATQNYVKQMTNPENAGFQRNFLDRVEAPNDTTVIFHLKNPTAYLFSSTYLANPTAQPIIPKEMLDVIETATPIGSGPYELTDHTFNVKYTYKKFNNYRLAKQGRPYFEGRTITNLQDVVAQEAAFRSDQIQEWLPNSAAVDRLNSELDKTKYANIVYLASGLLGFNAMMNFTKGGDRPWKDIRVREAMYRLVNRQQWIDLVYGKKGVVPNGPVHASLEAFQVESKETEAFYKEDVAAAKQLLSAANFDTSKEWEIICINTGVNSLLGEVWQQQLARADFKVRISPLPLAVHNPERVFPAQFDLFVGGQPGGDTPHRAMRNQHSDTGDQFTNVGLYDKTMDALIEKGEQATDREENIKLVKQAQLAALKAYSLSYIALTAQSFMYYSTRLQNWEIDPLFGQNYETQAWFSS